MLTLKEIEDIKFKKSGLSGYKAEEVDEFLDQIHKSFEQILKEKEELWAKLKVLAAKIEDYRKDEDVVKNALIKAQKISDQTLQEAKLEADDILKKAKFEATNIKQNSQQKIIEETNQLKELKQSVRDFRNKILTIYKEHIQSINNLTAGDRLSERENTNSHTEEREISSVAAENDNNKANEQPLHLDGKFSNIEIKFGDDYDISSDSQKQNSSSPLGLFNDKK